MTKSAKKKKTVKKPDIFELAVIVSERVQIKEVRLINCTCTQTPLASRGPQALDFKDFNVRAVQEDKKYILVFPSFRLEAKPEEEKSEKPSIAIEAEFLLIYELDNCEDIKQDSIEAFGRVNGIYNAWPYWREFVQSTIARMGLPNLTIPVFRLVAPQNKDNKQIKASSKKVQKKKKVSKKK